MGGKGSYLTTTKYIILTMILLQANQKNKHLTCTEKSNQQHEATF